MPKAEGVAALYRLVLRGPRGPLRHSGPPAREPNAPDRPRGRGREARGAAGLNPRPLGVAKTTTRTARNGRHSIRSAHRKEQEPGCGRDTAGDGPDHYRYGPLV